MRQISLQLGFLLSELATNATGDSLNGEPLVHFKFESMKYYIITRLTWTSLKKDDVQ